MDVTHIRDAQTVSCCVSVPATSSDETSPKAPNHLSRPTDLDHARDVAVVEHIDLVNRHRAGL